MKSTERFYDEYARQEWQRHDRHRIEFAVSMRTLADHLPPAPARLIDIGGGPGRYAIALAKRRYDVTLFDLSRECLRLAREKAAEAGVELGGYVRGNATRVELPSESYEAALIMGPLYHLLTLPQRSKALKEAARLLTKGGVIFASFVTRSAPIRDAAKRDPGLFVEKPEWFDEILRTGRFRPQPGRGFSSYTDAYLAKPSETIPFMERGGFETIALVACEGVVSMIDERVNDLDGEAWEAWVDLMYRLGKDVSMHGCAEHLLYVGRKF